MQIIKHYFPDFSDQQLNQYRHLQYLYKFWNDKINLISRRDIANLYVHHVLHSLSIAKFLDFEEGSRVLDIGTGGGFPGIPLAIAFPQTSFTLIDIVNKKTRVVEIIYRNLALQNVEVHQVAAQDMVGGFDFVVSRAVSEFTTLAGWSKRLIRHNSISDVPNGLIALKGGTLTEELQPFGDQIYKFDISDWFQEPFFKDKSLVYLPLD